MKIGEAVPLPWTTPWSGQLFFPMYDQEESPYAMQVKYFILQRVFIIQAAIFKWTPNLSVVND